MQFLIMIYEHHINFVFDTADFLNESHMKKKLIVMQFAELHI